MQTGAINERSLTRCNALGEDLSDAPEVASLVAELTYHDRGLDEGLRVIETWLLGKPQWSSTHLPDPLLQTRVNLFVAEERLDDAMATLTAFHEGTTTPMSKMLEAYVVRVRGDLDASERILREAVDRWPARQDVLHEYSHIAFERSAFDELLTRIDRYLSQVEGTERDFELRGMTLVQLGRYEEARAAYEAGLARMPNDPALLEHLMYLDRVQPGNDGL